MVDLGLFEESIPMVEFTAEPIRC